MKDKDTNDAIKLLLFVVPLFMLGLIIADNYNLAAGLLLSMSAIIITAVVLWLDGRNDSTKERLKNYIDDAGRRIEEYHTKEGG